MKLKTLQFKDFKRFKDLTIDQIPESARLIVIAGANGTGKSAIIEGLNVWRLAHGNFGHPGDPLYFTKIEGDSQPTTTTLPKVEFHGNQPEDQDTKRRCLCVRSAYRFETDFSATTLAQQSPHIDDPGTYRLIDLENSVSKNYKRMASGALQALFKEENDTKTVLDLRNEIVGRLQAGVSAVFEDLSLVSPGDPLTEGSFFFGKGTSPRFPYKNLSGGERAAFDLLLDFYLRTTAYNDTVYCIDEPELHIGSRTQRRLLEVLLSDLPPNCQLLIATHSIGMMRAALEHHSRTQQVVFFDMSGLDFDNPVVMSPSKPDRAFWLRTLAVALDDMSGLVAPKMVVLCEGSDPASGFDADCYRTIFASEYPDTEFVSVGSAHEVVNGNQRVAGAIQVVAPGSEIVRLVDRDHRTDHEIENLKRLGHRCLSRRNIESFLLDDDVLRHFCQSHGKPEADLLSEKQRLLANSIGRGNDADDLKKIRGDIQVFCRRTFGLTQLGSTADEFLRAHLAPMVSSAETVYAELRQSVFGS